MPQFEKGYWKPRTILRYVNLAAHFHRALIVLSGCTTMQVYDLAWSPTGEYIISGSTDNVARVFLASEGNSADPDRAHHSLGKCVFEIAEHNHTCKASYVIRSMYIFPRRVATPL